MKNYSVIAFDLDGTLTNPESGLIAGFKYALDAYGIDYGSDASLKKFIGPPLQVAWAEEYGVSREVAVEMLYKFREFYNVYGWWDNEPYRGVREMLAGLKAAGKVLILATSKPEPTAKKVLKLFDLDVFFDFIGGASTDMKRDKKHEVLAYSLASVGCADPEQAILVGDRMYDAEGASLCGIDSLGVLWGHGSREEIEASDFTLTAETPDDVLKALTQGAKANFVS